MLVYIVMNSILCWHFNSDVEWDYLLAVGFRSLVSAAIRVLTWAGVGRGVDTNVWHATFVHI